MSPSSESPLSAPTPDPGHFSRRSVVRTAAWSVPVVSLATAAPAFAASGNEVGVPLAVINYRYDGPLTTPYGELEEWLEGEVEIANLSDTADLTGLSLTLTFADEWLNGEFFDIQSATSDGWSGQGWTSPSRTDIPAGGMARAGGARALFTFAMPLLAPGQQKNLAFYVLIPENLDRNGNDVITLTVTPPAGWSLEAGIPTKLNWPSIS